ncbi:GlmU family protein [Cesiribacter andamanensis]|uniref:UDP-N-acetylglucosamine diphosphorylase/glucosamine-1-phosphate N-acetyltransferase n=1 Tax=Cesiribacter andamanensis AMV16 TaxID=1279009 RepID=M7P0S7_9BACT|nr:GlmU family protein [Cesiribacter andamanensis]EMR04194.1 UDP-N-acetylglucosamine diphosphorylase/glucosamine-1-phosphate N-acetyltransferase [Cesiribacter andamanensis AMV16]
MNLVLFDDPTLRQQLLPLSFTRPLAALRCGILTLAEKWQLLLPQAGISYLTQEYLQQKYPLHATADTVYLNGACCPSPELLAALQQLQPGQALQQGSILLAYRAGTDAASEYQNASFSPQSTLPWEGPLSLIQHPWDLFRLNGEQLRQDFALLTRGRRSAGINDVHTRCYGEEQIFVEEGVKIRAAILNAEDGPIYLGKGAQVHEGAIIKGPFALCEGAHVNVGGKMRSDTTIGPYCKAGGEISNSILMAHSNKGHEGFLGNSVLGEWCNLGADTNTSNLKNNYANVKVWSHARERFVDTGLQFCGLIMGDHSKAGINTMFNTGTMVGVSANIFGDGFPRTLIPSFAWGGAAGFSTYKFETAMETAERVLERRKLPLSAQDRAILQHVFELSAPLRVWEKKPSD